MAQTPLTKGRTLGDVLRNLWHNGYCLASKKLVNPLGAAIELNPLGQPVKASGENMVFVQDGDEANAIGIVVHDGLVSLEASPAVSTRPYPVLVRGPALVDRDSLPTEDVNGDDFDVDALVEAYEAFNPPLVPVDQPTTVSEHTT
jgi:hypothetical protein